MTISQALIFWLTVIAELALFRELERSRVAIPSVSDGLEPVNRKLMKMIVRQ